MTNAVQLASYGSTGHSLGFKNRIINGAMVINQRATSVTANATANTYTVDRWRVRGESSDGVFTAAQSSTAPTGFQNSLLITVTTADASIGAGQLYAVEQLIEGYNVADLGWGAAGAATVTLSFWVRSSLTGTFSGSLRNNAGDRSYPFTYTISAANTWEQKTVTVAGDTTGTWEKTTSTGMFVNFSLGVGSNFQGTSGAWNSNNNFGATGETAVISTSGATFYITGVQLEKGSTATSFDYRPYGAELVLCQRYYQQPLLAQALPYITVGFNTTTSEAIGMYTLRVPMRVSPSLIWSGTFNDVKSGLTGTSVITPGDGCTDSTLLLLYAFTGLTAGANNFIRGTASTSVPKFSAEL